MRASLPVLQLSWFVIGPIVGAAGPVTVQFSAVIPM